MSKLKKNAGALFLTFLLIFLGQVITGFWVSRELPKRLGIEVQGKFWPVFLLPEFYSNNAQFEWKNRITLLSGNLKIHYNVFPLLIKNSIRVKVSGKNITARLAGAWAKQQGVENIRIDTVTADVDVAPNGLGEIYLVQADSPSFHFHIKKTES